MKRQGVDQIFFAGTSLTEMADYVRKHYSKARRKRGRNKSRPDLGLARELTAVEDSFAKGSGGKKIRNQKSAIRNVPKSSVVFHLACMGKTTLIDELVLRFLQNEPEARIAILSHDPSADLAQQKARFSARRSRHR